jgi:hypothetical protein
MPYSKVDTALGNKKGSLLDYGTVDRKEIGGLEWQQAAAIRSNGTDVIRI